MMDYTSIFAQTCSFNTQYYGEIYFANICANPLQAIIVFVHNNATTY